MIVIFCNNQVGARSPLGKLIGNTAKQRLRKTRQELHVSPVLFLQKKLELDMDQTMGLSLEQQFSLRSFETQVERMSHEQAQDFLVKLYEQMMLRETMYKHFLKHEWGIESGPRLD
jgi:Phycobilisome degradation protein nblA